MKYGRTYWTHVIGAKGEEVPWGECLEIPDSGKPREWPLMSIRMMMKPRFVRLGEYHVTEVINPRFAYYARIQPYTAAIERNMSLFIGWAIHNAIQTGYPRYNCEVRVTKEYPTHTVTGSVDIVDPNITHQMYELKSSGNIKFVLEMNNGKPLKAHVRQASAYWSMLKGSRPKLAVQLKRVCILYISKSTKDIPYAELYSGEDFDLMPWDALGIDVGSTELHNGLINHVAPTRLCDNAEAPLLKPYLERAKYPCVFCPYKNLCVADYEKVKKGGKNRAYKLRERKRV